MAKENVAKFFEKLASDKALAEKLAAANKDYAGGHEVKAGDDAAKKAAVEEILLPIAKEAGFTFTYDELAAYEKDQQGKLEGEVSDDEMASAAGGCIGLPGKLCIILGSPGNDPMNPDINPCPAGVPPMKTVDEMLKK